MLTVIYNFLNRILIVDLKEYPDSKSTGINLRAKDKIFDDRLDEIGDFRFDDKVADAFDDMVQRSVPYYLEIQRMMAEMAADFATTETSLYDLGCSTGATFLALDK